MNSNVKNTRKKHRTVEEKKNLSRRLKIAEGQIRGIIEMVEEDRYCDEILIQIAAIEKSLESIGKEIIKGHLRTCVKEDLEKGNLNVVEDVVSMFERIK